MVQLDQVDGLIQGHLICGFSNNSYELLHIQQEEKY